MKKTTIILSFLLLLVPITSCRRGSSYVLKDKYTDKPAYGDMLVDSNIGEPATLNPVLASDQASFNIADMVFSGLVRFDRDLNIEGCLAKSWDISKDGKLITFHLRHGVKWHDGVEFTAQDVKFTYDMYMDPKTKTAYKSLFEPIQRIEIPDRYTVKVYYREVFAPALQYWGTDIIPYHLLHDKDINTAEFNRNPIGTGPYKFSKWITADRIELTANKDYFEGEPYISRYVCRNIPDQSVQFMEMLAGTLDMMALNSDLYFTKTNSGDFVKNFNRYQIQAPGYRYVAYNEKNPLFKDKNVRKALSYAIDKDAIIKGVLRGLAKPVSGPFIPGTWAYNDKAETYAYNTLTAMTLLKKAGWAPGRDGYLYKDGNKFEFTVCTNQGNKEREEIATILQQELGLLGIKVNVRILAWNIFITEFIDKQKFDAVVMGWSTTRDPDCYETWHSSKTKEGEFNFISYRNPEVDRLLIAGRTTFDLKKRAAAYKRIHALIADDAPYTFLYTPLDLPAVHKRVHGIVEAPAGIGWNFIHWYVPEEIQKYRVAVAQ
jgi:peptide/nickel transport system substrate-binding protein